tara:strand:- start:4650 stop:5855 length:1206 start_codon:yes stop_codon:yes gene_type:complete
MIKTIKNWVYALNLTFSFLYFSMFSILGIQYEGSENGRNYIYATAIFSLISLAFGLRSLLSSRFLNTTRLFFLILPLIITVIYIFENPNSDFAFRTYSIFISMVFPIIVIGLDLAKSKSLNQLYNPMFFVFIIITLGCIRILPQLTSIRLNDFTGGTQQFSYIFSFAFMIGLIVINDSEKIKSWYLKLATLISLLILFFGILLAGGRGAFLVILISIVIFTFRFFKKKNLPILLISIISIYLIFDYLMDKLGVRFLESTTRIFAYIDSSGINMDGTSNRGMFYEKALNIFSENILFGHGIFRYTIRAGEFYAHNIFLDILVQGGIILMILFLFLLLCFFNKLRKILKYDSKSNLILIFVIYSFTQLLFTGIYLQDTFFWFSLAYVFSYSFKPQLIHNNIDE